MKSKPLGRRQALVALGGAAAALVGCSGTSETSPTSPSTPGTGGGSSDPGSTNAACAASPNETAGPFPSLSQMVRTDIREGKPGTPLTLTITVVNAGSGCGPVAATTVEVWQCDATGNYSQYGTQTAATYLRGLQVTNTAGQVVFTTVYPGWYQGRATHIHVEVKVNGAVTKVTQIAFPESVNAAVYATGVYAPRGTNPTANTRDMVFADSLASELATVTGGDAATGYTASFQVGIA
jgi:protocatechuate 3,4-dioxygenase beta subunit